MTQPGEDNVQDGVSENTPSEIRGVLIPLQQQQLLLPNAAVAEVVDFQQPSQRHPTDPDWVLGSIAWRQRNLIIVRLEDLLGVPYVGSGVRQRIIVCHTLGQQAKWPFVGIVSTAIPRLVRVQEHLLDPQENPYGDDMPVHAVVKLDGQDAVVPDLAGLEARLSADTP